MITIQNVTKTFDGGVTAVNDLTLEFRPGVTGLVGHNGAGKSTLLRMIADVVVPNAGTILVDGKDHSSQEARADVFFLPDDPTNAGGNSTEDVLRFYELFYGLDIVACKSLMKKLGLPERKNIGTFSKGMRRQFFLSIALSVPCSNILLDEAFDGIDPLSQDIFKEEIRRLGAEGKTIVCSSHNLAALQSLASEFVLLYKGKLDEHGVGRDRSESIVKFQGLFPASVVEESFYAVGLDVISVKRVGSLFHIILSSSENAEATIRKELNPTLLEAVPVTTEEVVEASMLLAKKEDSNNDR